MSATISTASLLLYPQAPDWTLNETPDLITHLRDIGFIAAEIDPASTETAYFAGECFLELVAFMGCAPSIRFAPDDNSEHFTHIRLHQYDDVTALTGEHTRAPNCPQCKKAFTTWNPKLDTLTTKSLWTCEHCQQSAAPWDYQWRRSAGFARVFIEVTDIYPKEALPQQVLLEQLEHSSGIRWDYFYLY